MTKKFLYLKYMNIPNVLTESSVAIGFITLILMLNHEFKIAMSLYSLTILLDRIDGLAARKFRMESAFGKELDSLADFFNFCILPSIIAYLMGFNSILSVIILIIYILSGVSRLAHFNLTGMNEISGKQYFSGLPTTVSASWFLIVVSLNKIIIKLDFYFVLLSFFVVFSILMVSPLKFNKNGLIIKVLYILIPVAVIILWIF